MDTPVVLLHGFSDDQALAAMRAVKKSIQEAGGDPSGIAFAMSTPTNLGWKVEELVAEVAAEHEYMKKNGPGAAPAKG